MGTALYYNGTVNGKDFSRVVYGRRLLDVKHTYESGKI